MIGILCTALFSSMTPTGAANDAVANEDEGRQARHLCSGSFGTKLDTDSHAHDGRFWFQTKEIGA